MVTDVTGIEGGKRYNADAECIIDRNYQKQQTPGARLILWLFSRTINALTKAIICRAYERRIITIRQLHELTAMADRTIYPKQP